VYDLVSLYDEEKRPGAGGGKPVALFLGRFH
jgi:hypothetical protein